MMDARSILPSGWHFVAYHCLPDGVTPISPLARIDFPVRYVIIDFDCSVRLSPGDPHLIKNFGGRDGDPPEYRSREPYDPFKIDVFTLGNVFFKDFYQVYEGLDFLASLIDFMKTPNFRQRPDAEMAMKYWLNIRTHIDVGRARWRLQKRKETMGERVLYDTVAFARESVQRMKRMVTGEVGSSFPSMMRVELNSVNSNIESIGRDGRRLTRTSNYAFSFCAITADEWPYQSQTLD
ncbi:hypothetical protein H0H81_000866 [Sphagnurus paluster]|uniref:Uncharacterized protein n=1 Tax=Sphagnurus paluster TaxID=117069 RepID=A0A9P7GTX1_9AGAR|nr:hypothetical protein H0H81_000866 [Sphagnurus paluster]